MTSRRVLTREQERRVRSAVRRGATRRQAAAEAGISEWRLYQALRDQLSDLPPKRRGPRVGTRYRERTEFVDIPQDEIYRRAAALRAARWTDADYQAKTQKGFVEGFYG